MSSNMRVILEAKGMWTVHAEIGKKTINEAYPTQRDAKERAKQLSLENPDLHVTVMRKGVEEFDYYKGKIVESSEFAHTDDYGILPGVREAGSLRNRSYVPVSDEDMVTEEDEEDYMPMYDVGTEFEISRTVKGIAGLEIGVVYRIGSVDEDPPTYAIIGDKNRKVAEINAKLFDGIVGGDYDDEEGQDDDAQDDDIEEDRLMELDMEKKRASIGRKSILRTLGADVVGSLTGKAAGKNKSAKKMARKELARQQTSGTGCKPGFKMVFGTCRAVEESRDFGTEGELGDLGEASDADVGHYRIDGGKTYADTAFMNAIGNTMPGMAMSHMGFGEFELTGDKGSIQFDRMRGKDFEGQVGRSHLVYDDKGGKLVKELISKMEKAGKLKLVEGVTAEVKMKVPLIFKKKGDKGGKDAPLEVLKGLRESLIGGSEKDGCGCAESGNSEADEAMATLKRLGFSDKDAKKVFDLFMDNMLSQPKFAAAAKGIKLPPKVDWGSVYHRLYGIYD